MASEKSKTSMGVEPHPSDLSLPSCVAGASAFSQVRGVRAVYLVAVLFVAVTSFIRVCPLLFGARVCTEAVHSFDVAC